MGSSALIERPGGMWTLVSENPRPYLRHCQHPSYAGMTLMVTLAGPLAMLLFST